MLSFQQFIAEGAIAIGDYQLEAKYQHFNHLLFNGELPKIPITWSKSLGNISGIVRAQGRNFGFNVVQGTIRMEISSLFKSSEERLDGIMLHEMIHVYFFAIKDDGRESHGAGFKAKLAELQAKCDFTIPLTDNVTELELDNGVRASEIGVILKTDEKGTWAAFIGKTAWLKYEQRIIQNITRRQAAEVRSGIDFVPVKYTFHFGRTNLHRKYKVFSDGSYAFYKLQPQEAENLQALPRIGVDIVRFA